MKSLVLVLCPFGYAILLSVFWLIYKFYTKSKFSRIFENFIITLNMTFLYFQSPIVNFLSEILNCTEIENQFYISNYLLERCSENPRYMKWRNYFVIPCFSFFTIIFSFAPLYYMYINKQTLYSKAVFRKIGFLLNGYSFERFYWYLINNTIDNYFN